MKKVKCIANDGCPRMLTVGKIYDVSVEVTNGIDHKNRPCAGYILKDQAFIENGIQRVWDFRRFVVMTEEEVAAHLAAMEEARRLEEEAEYDAGAGLEEDPEQGSQEEVPNVETPGQGN